MPHTFRFRCIPALLFALLPAAALAATPPSLIFSTYLGGTGTGDNGEFWVQSTVASVVIDQAGNVIVTGDTNTPDITAEATFNHRTGSGTTNRDVYVAKLDPTGRRLLWIAFLGGTGDEDRASAALAPDGSIYVVTRTNSTVTTTTGAYQAANAGGNDVLITHLSADGATLLHQTYLGGSGNESPTAIAVDATGQLYITGTTEPGSGVEFPTSTTGVVQPNRAAGSTDAFVSCIAFGGNGATSLSWSTFFGGTGTDQGLGIGLTPSGAVLLSGFTASTDLPALHPVRATLSGAGDFFVARLSSNGQTRDFATYLGGGGDEGGGGTTAQAEAHLVVISEEQFVVAGLTNSTDFPTVNASDTTLSGIFDAFVTRMRWNGTALSYVFSTYLGGDGADAAFDVGVDAAGNTTVTGARQNAAGTAQDVFLTRLSPSGGVLWDTTYGGTGYDVALGMAAGPFGDIYLTGQTLSADLPIRSLGVNGTAYDTTLGGTRDAFVARFAESGGPSITSATPNIAPVGGGTTIRLSGTNFETGASVTVGGAAATSVVVLNPTTITLVVPAGTIGTAAIVVTNPSGQSATLSPGFAYDADTDGDGLPDSWEQQYGFTTTSGAGNNGATGDPDNDGASNLKEFTDGTNPIIAEVRYFAEGATINPFTMRIALLNADPFRTATAVLQFLLGGSRQGEVVTRSITINPRTRATVNPGTDYASVLASAEFSTAIRSNLPLAADRLMTWNSPPFGTGSHEETAVLSPAEEWFLAEGATLGNFQLYYLIQNPNDTPVDVDVSYLLPSGPLPVRTYAVAANSRFNIFVNNEPGLSNAEVSAILRSPAGKPIIVERAMYLSTPAGFFEAGHESAGVTHRSKSWFFAEGATGSFFDLFILVANPGDQPATVTANFLSTQGEKCSKVYPNITPRSRFNIWVDKETVAGCPIDFANTALSTTLSSDVDIVAERAMWWSSDPDASAWYEAHNSPGAIASGTTWEIAEGEVGNQDKAESYILIANTSNFPGSARVTLYFEDGTTVDRLYALPANSRTNVPVGETNENGGFGLAVANRRFGALVESLTAGGQSGPALIVVERALYATPPGTPFWSQGGNALGVLVGAGQNSTSAPR